MVFKQVVGEEEEGRRRREVERLARLRLIGGEIGGKDVDLRLDATFQDGPAKKSEQGVHWSKIFPSASMKSG